MKGITFNEAAFLYCILGSPESITGRLEYPTVEEAVDYFFSNSKKKAEPAPKREERLEYIQLSMF